MAGTTAPPAPLGPAAAAAAAPQTWFTSRVTNVKTRKEMYMRPQLQVDWIYFLYFQLHVRGLLLNSWRIFEDFSASMKLIKLRSSCISQTFTMSHWSSLLPATGGTGSCPGGATLTMELSSPVSDVSPHWWPRRYPWPPATIGLFVHGVRGDTSHSSCPSSVLTVGHRLWRHTVPLGSRKAHTRYWGGALWSSYISHTFTMSHWVKWTHCLLPATEGGSSCPWGCNPHLGTGITC